jgi:hypothetical protein
MAEKAKATAKPADAGKTKYPRGKATAAAATDDVKCSAEKCKQPARAKGYCRKHFMSWRRGALGEHHRYKICSKEGCRKPRALGGLCAEHSAKGAPAEGAAA